MNIKDKINNNSCLSNFDKKSIKITILSYCIDFNVIDLERFVWLKDFDCEQNFSYKSNLCLKLSSQPIVKIINPPITLEKINCSGNNIINLDNFSCCYNLKYIDCSENLIRKLDFLPIFLIELDVSDNKIISMDKNLPYGLKKLNCSSNKILSLNNLPEKLEELDCSRNLIVLLNNLPSSLIKLSCSNNNIIKLDNLPTSLKYIDCSKNLISDLDLLPSSIETLICYINSIKNFDNLPSTIKNICK